MKRTTILWCCLLGLCPFVQAQHADATRYRNAQGIEVIQNRSASVREELAAQPAPVSREAQGAAIAPKAGPQDAAFQISAKEQAQRDRDRQTILQDELGREIEAYQGKVRMLQANTVKASLPDDQVARLKELAAVHEKNIRALQAELGRVRREN